MNYDKWISSPSEDTSNAKIPRMEYENRASGDCSAFARWRVTIEPRWLRRFSLSLSPSSFFFFFFLPLSPMIIHVRGARHDRQSILLNDTLPLPLFRWWFHVPTCCFSIPCYGNRGKRKERSRIFCSCDFKFRRGGGGGRDLRGKTRVS